MVSVQRIKFSPEDGFPPVRGQHVTASVYAALHGLSPWMTAGQLFAEKQGIDFGDANRNKAILERGQDLEPVVAKKLKRTRPDLEIWKADEYLFDPDLRLGCTPDYYGRDQDGKRLTVQIKTVGRHAFERHWSDSPPSYVALQNAVEVMLDDADYGLIAALVFDEFSTFELRTYDLPRITGAEKRIIETVQAFWRNFDLGIPPKIDYERDGALIALMYPTEVEGKVVDLRSDNRMPELLEERDRLAALIKDAETKKTGIDNEIKTKIGDAESALVRGWRVTLKLQTRKAHQVKESSFRVLKSKKDVPDEEAA